MKNFDTFTKIANNVRDLGKLIVAKGFKKLPKAQKIDHKAFIRRAITILLILLVILVIWAESDIDVSGIQTRIIREEDVYADHLTTMVLHLTKKDN